MSIAACFIKSTALSRSFSDSRRICSEVGFSGMTPSCHGLSSDGKPPYEPQTRQGAVYAKGLMVPP